MMVTVMGCYRTGTSAVAGICHYLGVNMGTHFQLPNVGNPKGYFEDRDFKVANAKLYEAGRMRVSLGRDRKIAEARDYWHELTMHRSDGDLWGFKDPRFCLTAKHVMGHYPSAKIIWIHRDIDETVMSIIKALGLNGLDADPVKWRSFVEHYVNETSNFMAGHNATNILDLEFPEMIHTPITEITRIAEFLEIPTTPMAYEFME